MGAAEKLELLRLLEERHRRRARDDLNAYCQYIEIPGVPINDDPDCDEFYPDTVTPAAHHRLINDTLMRVEAGELRRVMIFMPPGSAKSTYGSVTFPTWFMGRKPGRNVISTSYGSTLAAKFGRKCRQVTRSPRFTELFGCELVADNKAADDWSLTNGSTYMAGGILAGITGNRADLLVIDDPIKGREEADSVTIREKVWEEYKSSLRTRLKPNGAIVIIQTRWHEDDMAGRILPPDWCGQSGWVTGRDGERWYVICLPAQCEREDDPLGRQIGEWLWTDWFSPAHWEQERRTQGSRNWDALYQQRPRPQEGGMFKEAWARRYGTAPAKPTMIVQSVDTAFKPGQLNDPSVVETWAITPAGYYLLHVWRDRVEYPRLKRTVLSLAERFKPNALLIEDKASGQSLIQDLREVKNPPPVIAIEPEGDKLTRANAVSPMVEAGLVFLPQAADWLADFESEVFAFPLSTHDDQVDALTQFLAWARKHGTDFRAYGSGQRRAGLAADPGTGPTPSGGFGWGTMGGTDTSGFL
jgi:predicted phage terminase large subunit-like protein